MEHGRNFNFSMGQSRDEGRPFHDMFHGAGEQEVKRPRRSNADLMSMDTQGFQPPNSMEYNVRMEQNDLRADSSGERVPQRRAPSMLLRYFN